VAGEAGTVTTVGLSQAARVSVASTAVINSVWFMVNPLEVGNWGTDSFEPSASKPTRLRCRTRNINSIGECRAPFSALANIETIDRVKGQ
jgi:hypothetical protein